MNVIVTQEDIKEMNITLKNIKVMESMSDETNCFTATLYINGKKATDVRNTGRGGCHMYGDYKVEQKVNEYAETLSPITYTLNDETYSYPQDCDTIVDEIIEEFLKKKDLKKLHSKHICFRVHDYSYDKGQFHQYKMKYSPIALENIKAKHGGNLQLVYNNLGEIVYESPSKNTN